MTSTGTRYTVRNHRRQVTTFVCTGWDPSGAYVTRVLINYSPLTRVSSIGVESPGLSGETPLPYGQCITENLIRPFQFVGLWTSHSRIDHFSCLSRHSFLSVDVCDFKKFLDLLPDTTDSHSSDLFLTRFDSESRGPQTPVGITFWVSPDLHVQIVHLVSRPGLCPDTQPSDTFHTFRHAHPYQWVPFPRPTPLSCLQPLVVINSHRFLLLGCSPSPPSSPPSFRYP